ncbi:MAG: DUF2179 domain-containing protein [Candidatus Latescibacterota bacterium]|nr:MAG: DUF2179 domain-containing protein [Candidatus Latescibacterota bacterium]
MAGEEPLQIVILSVLIFLARVADVSLGTMRIVFISRGQKILAPIVGFVEILIWLFAIRQIIGNLDNVAFYASYAGGYAAGTFAGLRLEDKLALGSRIIRVITKADATELIQTLRKHGYGVTSVDAQGGDGKVHLFFSVIKRHDLPNVIELVNKFNPKAFYSIEDVRFAREGIFPARELFVGRRKFHLLRSFSKFR